MRVFTRKCANGKVVKSVCFYLSAIVVNWILKVGCCQAQFAVFPHDTLKWKLENVPKCFYSFSSLAWQEESWVCHVWLLLLWKPKGRSRPWEVLSTIDPLKEMGGFNNVGFRIRHWSGGNCCRTWLLLLWVSQVGSRPRDILQLQNSPRFNCKLKFLKISQKCLYCCFPYMAGGKGVCHVRLLLLWVSKVGSRPWDL